MPSFLDSSKPEQATQRVTRAVVFSQLLFTAGHSLTTGGFLSYFVYQFHPSAFFLAAVHVAPESSEALSFFTGAILNRVRSRKWLWIVCLILGRISALLIPAALLFQDNSSLALPVILGALIVWHLFQGVAYCSYISWLSELVPELHWGEFFAKRKMASLFIAMAVPIGAGLAKRKWIAPRSDQWKSWSFAVIFGIGALLVIASIIPMLWIPDRPVQTKVDQPKKRFRLGGSLSKPFRWLLVSRWWLSFFQGLTQSVVYLFSVKVLGISLDEYYILLAVMLSIQMLTSWWAGILCDQSRDKKVLFWSLIGVSFAMWFWWAATPGSKWIAAGAYLIWGGFGFVNVALINLTLKLAPSDDNALHISLSRLGSGLVAGIAGMVGGYWLDQLLQSTEWEAINAYKFLFLISWGGRITAALWLLPMRQPVSEPSATNSTVSPT